MRDIKPYKVQYAATGVYQLTERPTGHILDQSDDCRSLKQQANFLNGGNGFNGYTPTFFLESWSYVYNG